MRLVLTLALIGFALTFSHASTVLISHHGSTTPTTEGWAIQGTNSNVITTAVQVGGRNVLRLEDPGYVTGTNGKTSGRYYEKILTADQRNEAHTLGWSLSASISIPTDYPTSGVAWNSDSSTWVGYGYDFPNTSAPTIDRRVYALMFGRTATGQTRVQLYSSGNSFYRDLDPGFHEYRMDFDPTTQMVSVYIDGVYWRDYAGNKSTGESSAASRLYWGDNNNQGSATAWRAADYESVVMSIVPEPQRMLFMMLSTVVLFLRRRR